jgi:hypothetical protein
LIVWCKNRQHQEVEPDPAEMAQRHGAETPVPDWRERLVCSRAAAVISIWWLLASAGRVRAHAFRSHLSLARASAIVCHWRLETTSGPPQASALM